MALPLTSHGPAWHGEDLMRRVPRSEWMEWLDSLSMAGPVQVLPLEIGASESHHRFCGADYDPFDDVVEIGLADDVGPLRLLLDRPSEILISGPWEQPNHVTILAEDGPVVIRAVDSQAPRLRSV